MQEHQLRVIANYYPGPDAETDFLLSVRYELSLDQFMFSDHRDHDVMSAAAIRDARSVLREWPT
jgi:hypothetical protein